MIIPLKRKYLSGFKSRHPGGEKPAPKKHRNKVTNPKLRDAIHASQPKVTLVVNGLTGKGVFHKEYK
jgi:hypothetical protein